MSENVNYVVTNLAKAKMLKARAGLGQLAKVVGMAFGDGSFTDGHQRMPLASDTSLQHELLRQDIDRAVLQDDGISVKYSCTLGRDTLVGKNINEIALYDTDSDLVAIQSFSNKGKDADMEMIFHVVDKYSD